jgi:hypothetical protein
MHAVIFIPTGVLGNKKCFGCVKNVGYVSQRNCEN